MANFDAESLRLYLAERERRIFAGLKPAELQFTALGVIRDYEEEIRVLHERIQEVKIVYNSGAAINRLPIELLTPIFREVGPRTSPTAALRLTHVCRWWRTLIHDTPGFWVDFLASSKDTLGRTAQDLPIIRMAFEKSAPVPGLRFSLSGAFLPSLKSLTYHVERITTLSLVCTGTKSWDMYAFFGLRLSHLEDLSVELTCRTLRIPDDASINTPRLRRLRMSCVTFAVRWIKPTVRELSIGLEGNHRRHYDAPCCTLKEVNCLWDALRGPSRHLKSLELNGCISDAMQKPREPRLDMSSLESLHVSAEETYTVRALLECMKLPAATELVLGSQCPYRELGNMGIGVPCIRDIGSVAIDMTLVHQLVKRCVVKGYGERDERRLTLCSTEMDWHHADLKPANLRCFFQGVMSLFLGQTISRLAVSCDEPLPFGKREWRWLFQGFPGVVDLKLTIPSSAKVCDALARADILPSLQHLRLGTNTDKTAVTDKALVATLERRASGGMLLQSLTFARHAAASDQIQDACPRPEVASVLWTRLGAIAQKFSFYIWWGTSSDDIKEIISLEELIAQHVPR